MLTMPVLILTPWPMLIINPNIKTNYNWVELTGMHQQTKFSKRILQSTWLVSDSVLLRIRQFSSCVLFIMLFSSLISLRKFSFSFFKASNFPCVFSLGYRQMYVTIMCRHLPAELLLQVGFHECILSLAC